MNPFVPDWTNMGDTSRPLGEEDDLIELLWCNGHVVMQSQSNRKLPPRPEKAAAAAAPAAVAAQDDETGLWFPYALVDSLDKDIFSDFFCEAPAAPVDAGKPCRDVPMEEDGRRGGGACAVSEAPCDLMPPPKATHVSCSRQKTMSLADGDLLELAGTGPVSSGAGEPAVDAGASSSSMLSAIGSSICGSNQVLAQRAADTAHHGEAGSAAPSAVGSANRNASAGGRGHEATTVASSSGRYSNGCFTATTTTTGTEPTSTSNRSSKRKRLDTEDSESPSEDAESESAAMMARKPPQKLATARRSRAAEVHNLSERRRRDRINEKMRALQELIPHCNKTDKASMLNEAIEYLKSLQMQLQMMWMGGGMAAPPVMFPGVHQYLPRMGMGTVPMPPVPRMPFMAAAQTVVPGAPVSPVPLSPGYRVHMPAVGLGEPFAHFVGVNHMPPTPSQGVSYYPVEMKAVQRSPTLHVPGGSSMATPGAVLPPESAPNRGTE